MLQLGFFKYFFFFLYLGGTNLGVVAGAGVAGLLFLLIIIVLVVCFIKVKRKKGL